MPFAEGDLTVVAPRSNADRTAFLLSAIDIVRKGIVRAHMIELGGRLIVPGGEGLPAIDRDDGALVTRNQQDIRVIGIDPDAMIVIPSRSTAIGIPGHPAIRGSPNDYIRRIDDVFIFRVGLDLGEIIATPPETLVAVQFFPGLPCVVTAIDAAIGAGVHGGIQPGRVRWRNAKPDAAETLRRLREALASIDATSHPHRLI